MRCNDGLSLIELLVSLTIFGLLTVLALPALVAWERRAGGRGAAADIAAALALAREQSAAQATRSGVLFLRRPDRFVVFRDDDGDGQASASEILQGPSVLPSGVAFGRPSGLDPITLDRDRAIFRPDGSLDGRPGAVCLGSGETWSRITVITNGRIRVE